jgi:hypothetical protein
MDQSVFIPCANGGAGEDVTLNGPLHILTTVTLTKNDAHVKLQANPQAVTGVGSVTGNAYKATGITRDDVSVHVAGFPANETLMNNFRLIGKAKAQSLLVHQDLHFTINANGTVTASHDNLSVECK